MSEQQKDSPLEQLAQRFEIYASDIEAMLKRGYSMKGGKAHQRSRVATFLAVAAELRIIETQMLEQDRILLVCSASTRLPVAE